MNRKPIVEALVLLLTSMGGVLGGLSHYFNRDARTQSSFMAPGIYIVVISVALALTALAYLYLSFRKASLRKVNADSPQSQGPWISTIVITVGSAFAVYAYLIEIIGYLVSTLAFLIVAFRLLGVKSWKTNVTIAAVVAVGYYIVFIKYCEMIFPRGILYTYYFGN